MGERDKDGACCCLFLSSLISSNFSLSFIIIQISHPLPSAEERGYDIDKRGYEGLEVCNTNEVIIARYEGKPTSNRNQSAFSFFNSPPQFFG